MYPKLLTSAKASYTITKESRHLPEEDEAPEGQFPAPALTSRSSLLTCSAFSGQRRLCHRRYRRSPQDSHSSILKNSLSSSAI
jgi:hypothetical protein